MKHICETIRDYIDAMNTSMQGDTIFCTEELWNQIHYVKSQPERLNPEDERESRELEFFRNNLGALSEYLRNFKDPSPLTFVCDSLNTANK